MDRLKQASLIDAIIDGHVHGVVAYLGLKTKSVKGEKPMAIEVMKQLEDLKAIVKSQTKWITLQKAKENMEYPKWTEEGYEYYKDCIDDNIGFYDFWRLLVINYRNERIGKTSSI
ncbi:hypothetical protein MHI12_17830 [Paenibacillus sp. FSL H8-0280]|uniref:hypothetical protein n=1 Tax=Paenibacillus sp. FSL H8-0280 TaxID=2921382 RepID=UPI0032507CAD